jgi:uncharacterized protein YcfJ
MPDTRNSARAPVAIAGGVLGNPVGRGSGRWIATGAGHQVGKHVQSTRRYEVLVRMGGGRRRTFSCGAEPGWRAGGKLRVVDGARVAG